MSKLDILKLNSANYNNESMLRNFDLFKKVINSVTQQYPITMSIEKYRETYLEVTQKVEELDESIRNLLNISYRVDYSSRLYCNDSIFALMPKYYQLDPNFFVKNGNFISNEGQREKFKLLLMKLNIYNTTNPKENLYELHEQYRKASTLLSSLQKLHPYLATSQAQYPDAIKKGLFNLFPVFGTRETFRMQGEKPNIQGMQYHLKQFMSGGAGKEIASIDIKSQEVWVLVNGYLGNDKIKSYTEELKDPIKGIMKFAGLDITDTLRQVLKVPLLGSMRGMQLSTAKWNISEFYDINKDPQTWSKIEKAINYILKEDPVFYKKVTAYNNQQKSRPTPRAKGLLGTEQVLPPNLSADALNNKLMNGHFQITAGEIFCLSYLHFMWHVRHTLKLSYDDIRITMPIFDEIVIEYKTEYRDIALDLLDKMARPLIDDWTRPRGVTNFGEFYIAK